MIRTSCSNAVFLSFLDNSQGGTMPNSQGGTMPNSQGGTMPKLNLSTKQFIM